jgi:hypothetical protein
MAGKSSKKNAPRDASGMPETEEWIYTVRPATGEIVKIERVDPASGERQDVPVQDYLRACAGYGAYGASPYGTAFDPYAFWGYGY